MLKSELNMENGNKKYNQLVSFITLLYYIYGKQTITF